MSNKAPLISQGFSRIYRNHKSNRYESVHMQSNSSRVHTAPPRSFPSSHASYSRGNSTRASSRPLFVRKESHSSNGSYKTIKSAPCSPMVDQNFRSKDTRTKLPSISAVDSTTGQSVLLQLQHVKKRRHPLCNMPIDVSMNLFNCLKIKDLFRLALTTKGVIDEVGWKSLYMQRFETCGPKLKFLEMKFVDASRLQLQKDFPNSHERMFQLRNAYKKLSRKPKVTHRSLFTLRTMVQEDRVLRHNQFDYCRKREKARLKERRKRSEQKVQRQEEARKLTNEALMMVQARGTVRSHERPAHIRNSNKSGFLAPGGGKRNLGSSYTGSENMARCLVWPESM